MKPARLVVLISLALIIALLMAVRALAPGLVERRMNGVYAEVKPLVVSERAKALHARLFIADLHADPLLWGRDLSQRSPVGHLDLPRMREGNLALQTFAVTTKTPRNLNIDRNDAKTDNVLLLALVGGWPWRTLESLKERTLFTGGRLQKLAAMPGSGLRPIRSRQDLSAFVEARKRDNQVVGGMLSIEGLHALEGNLENVNALDDAGFRMIGLAHFFDNEVAGSAHGMAKGGLTELGRKLIPELERRHMLVDVAHSSTKTIDEVLAMTNRPVVVSHTGVKGTCDNNRNLSDAQIKAVAATGGLIGIGYWDEATCAHTLESIVRAITYAVKVAGPAHVALGSDFDGATFTPFDSAGLPQLTEALLASGMDEATIAAVMGENFLRLLTDVLP